MRRLTLILSDLYLRDDEARELSPEASDAMPHFEWLLRFAASRISIADWRGWLAADLGYAPSDLRPLAPFAARGQVAARDAWLATPVHLAARLDHVRLEARGVMSLSRDERCAWCEAFARTFAPQYALHDDGVGGFFLSGLAPNAEQAVTHDPARWLGTDIGASVPRGPEADELRRLGAEIEMWLHGGTLNAGRMRSGLPPVTSLWLWGGGAMRAPRHTPHVAADFYGAEPFLAALARDAEVQLRASPRTAWEVQGFEPAAERVIVVLAPLSGEPRRSLGELDRDWMGFARGSIEGGDVSAVDVVANDVVWHIAARPWVGFQPWWFWRKRRGWVEHLMRPRRDAKA